MPSSAHIFETVLFFLRRERKERFQSSRKRKRAVRNLKCSPCRHRVRRRLFRSASTGAAKSPHPQPPSSFPNCDRFTGSQFGHTVKTETFIRRKSRERLWSMKSPANRPKGSLVVSFFSSRCDTVLFFLRIEKEKNGAAKFPQPFSCCCFLLSMAALTAASWKYSFCFCFRSRSCSFRRVFDTLTGL